MNTDLTRLIEDLAADAPQGWESVAMNLYKDQAPDSKVWPRFAVWMLRNILQYFEEANEVVEQVIKLYFRVLDSDYPSLHEWQSAQEAASKEEFVGWDAARAARDAAWAATAQDEAAWAITRATRFAGSWKAIREDQVYYLMLYLQLERTPRGSRERYLQQLCLQDHSMLPNYCEYLEAVGDSVVTWIREVDPSPE